MKLSLLITIFLVKGLFGQDMFSSGEGSGLRKSYDELIAELKNSVVKIRVTYTELERKTCAGSGVIISSDGYVLTAAHVVSKTDPSFEVKLVYGDEKYEDVELIGDCFPMDVAVLKINSQRKFIPIKKGNSDQLVVGSWVLVYGALIELKHGPLQGKVIAKKKDVARVKEITGRIYKFEDLMKIDLRGRLGYSGSPVVNREGELVGVLVLGSDIWEFRGTAMSLPINKFEKKIDDLIKRGKLSWGWLGIEVKDVDDYIAVEYELEEESGVLVKRVVGRSPAKKGGIKPDDVIIKMDNQKITNTVNLKKIIKNTKPDQEIELIVIRDFEKEIVNIKLGIVPDDLEMTDFRF